MDYVLKLDRSNAKTNYGNVVYGRQVGRRKTFFIEIREDYSDLESQMNFYINNPEICLHIIKNANNFCEQFYNQNIEDLCSLWVLEKHLNLPH